MAYSLSPWLKPRFFITGTNRPLAGGLLYSYMAGTTTPQNSYSDDSGTLNTNPIVLDADGQCNLYLADDLSYRFILKDADGVTQFDKDNITGQASSRTQSVDTIYDLLSITPTTTGTWVIVASYWGGWATSSTPRGGGVFVWSPTMAKSRHNGGTIISPTVPWDGTAAGHASFSGTTSGNIELPVGVTTGGYPPGDPNNITNVRTRLPVMSGFLGGSGETQPSGIGCWVREDNVYSFCNFGAKGDAAENVNGTDDSYAMLQAVRSVPTTGGVLHIEPYYYTHGNGDNRVIFLYMDGYKNITINGYGAVIQSHSSNPALVANCGFWFVNSSNITINGLKFDGRLDVRTPIVSDPNQTNKQHGFNIGLNCHHVTLNHCIASRCMMDGFVVGGSTQAIPSPSKVTLRNCVSEYNYRQGLSVLRCAGLLVSGGSYSNTGQLGVGKGTSPMAGIDSESEGVASGYYNFGLVIDGATLDNNKGAGLYFALGSLKSVIRGCTVTNNGAYGVACTAASKECVIENNYIKNNGYTNSSDGCEIYNLGYNNLYTGNALYPSTRAILDIRLVSGSVAGADSVFDGNTIDNTENTAEAGWVSITQARSYINNKHLNLQSAIAGHAVNIDSPKCVVRGNVGINTNVSNTSGFLRANMGLVVADNYSFGYPLVSGFQIYIRPASLTGSSTRDKVISYGRNYEDFSPKVGLSGGEQIGLIDYPPVFHNSRRMGSASAAPTTGDWQQGDVIWRSNTSATLVANSNAHWVCTTSGTFSAVAATGDTTNGSKVITNPSNMTNIFPGSFITVAGAGITNSLVTLVDTVANTITVTANATATLTGAAISASAPVFTPKGYQSVKGSTASRPALGSDAAGYLYFDTTLVAAGKPIWWSGTAWLDSTGAAV